MPRDANGNYTLPLPDVIGGNPIEADGWANPTLADIANVLQDSLSRTGQGGMLSPFQNVDGAVGTPGITFTNEPTMGVYRAASGDMRIAIGGLDIARWVSTGLELWDGNQWNPVSSGGLMTRTSADAPVVANTEYAVVSNVPVGTYKFEGVCLLSRQSSGYDITVSMGIVPTAVGGVEHQDTTKFSRIYFTDPTGQPGAYSYESNLNFGSIQSLAVPADSAFESNNNIIKSEGVVTVTAPGDIAWKTFAAMPGWINVLSGTYISLTKI